MTDEQATLVDEEVVITIDDTQDPPPVDDVAPPPTEPEPPPTPGRTSTVTLQGKKFSPAFRDALREMIRLVRFDVRITQGGFNGDRVAASAGTHAGDAVDFSVRGLTESQVTELIRTARMVGIATWFRTTSKGKWGTRAHGFKSYHVHGVPNGWGMPSKSAAKQATSYRAGKDGLKQQKADLGPGHVTTYRKQTWQSYLANRNATQTSSITPRVDESKLPALIVEDGIFGPQTIRRLQRQVHVPQTGTFDTATKSAVRTWLRFQPGPDFDTAVISALQGRLKVTRDGDFGPVTIRALQTYLNTYRTH